MTEIIRDRLRVGAKEIFKSNVKFFNVNFIGQHGTSVAGI